MVLLFGFNLRLQPIITLQPATLLSIVNLVLKTFGSQDGILHPRIIQGATKEGQIEFITKCDVIKEPSERSSQKNLWNHFEERRSRAVATGVDVLFTAVDCRAMAGVSVPCERLCLLSGMARPRGPSNDGLEK